MLNNFSFLVLGIFTLASATAALRLRNPVHCALAAAATFAGLAATYLQLNAEFIAFAQLLIYVGAISILVLFAVLLTRGSEVRSTLTGGPRNSLTGLAIAALVLAAIVWPLSRSQILIRAAPPTLTVPVRSIGEELLGKYLLPLESIGLLLTAALIGAAVIAMRDPTTEVRATREPQPPAKKPNRRYSRILEEVAL
jgi:NADH-quinone oxidoreductase subunit J